MDECTAAAATGDGAAESTHTGHIATAHTAAPGHRCSGHAAVGRWWLQRLGRRLCAASTSTLCPAATRLGPVAAATTTAALRLSFGTRLGKIWTPLLKTA